MKSTVPVGTGRMIQRGRDGLGYVSIPEFLMEGARSRLQEPRPGRGRGGRRLRRVRRARRGPLRAARRRNRPHRRGERGDGQARVQRLPCHQDLLHQRDRERLRGARSDVQEVAREQLDERIGPKFLQAGVAMARLFSEGRTGPQAARRQHRLSLPAPHGGRGGERAPEAADDQQAAEAPRVARGQGDRPARRCLQAEHRRCPRGHQPRAGRAAPGGGRHACTTRSRRAGPGDPRRGSDLRLRPRRRRRRPRRGARHRVAGVSRARLGG